MMVVTNNICLACRLVVTQATETVCPRCGMLLEEQCTQCQLPQSECVCSAQ